MMRGQIVSSISDTGIQTRLSETVILYLESAKQLIITMEVTKRDSRVQCPHVTLADTVGMMNFVELPRWSATASSAVKSISLLCVDTAPAPASSVDGRATLPKCPE